mmetsp:Transcript_5332/g.13497  ORF Transcript_5332/g.13497 Transcript_5332/m.13497 type:complete len:564 (+) Transcript_5332:66-1757(+)
MLPSTMPLNRGHSWRDDTRAELLTRLCSSRQLSHSGLPAEAPSSGPATVAFDPNSTVRGCWDALVLVALVYTLLAVPLRIAFGFQLQALEIVVDIIFIADVGMNFETGISYRGKLVMDRRKVQIRYLTTWFGVDLVSSTPQTLFVLALEAFTGQTAAHHPGLLLTVRLMPVAKVLRIPRLFRYTLRWQHLLPFSSGVQRSFQLVFFALLFSHWDACFLFLLGSLEGEGWLQDSGLIDEPALTQYSYCLYASLGHMTGQGAETGLFKASRLAEVWVCMLSITVGVTFYTFLLGQISSIIQSADRNWDSHNIKLDRWGRFCRIHGLPSKLQKRGFKALAAKPTRGNVDNAVMLREFKPALRAQISLYMKLGVIQKHCLFEGCPEQMMGELAAGLTQKTWMDGETIAEMGQPVASMFFIMQGEVTALDSEQGECEQLVGGESFGEEGVLAAMEAIRGERRLHAPFAILEQGPFAALQQQQQLRQRQSTPAGARHLSHTAPVSPSQAPAGRTPIWTYRLVCSEPETLCYVLSAATFGEVAQRTLPPLGEEHTIDIGDDAAQRSPFEE